MYTNGSLNPFQIKKIEKKYVIKKVISLYDLNFELFQKVNFDEEVMYSNSYHIRGVAAQIIEFAQKNKCTHILCGDDLCLSMWIILLAGKPRERFYNQMSDSYKIIIENQITCIQAIRNIDFRTL